MTATGTPRHRGSTGRRGLALPWANRFKSGLLDIPLPLHIYYKWRNNVCRWNRHHDKDDAYRRCRTYPAIYRDSWWFSKAKVETLPPHQSIAIYLELGYNLPYGRISNFSELGGALFTQLRGLRSHAHEAGSWICIGT